MTFSERGFIEQIRARSKNQSGRLITGIGDDCAVISNGENQSPGRFGLFTSDALVESVHFDLSWHPAKLLGRKSLSVNLSDIAAMGGKPLYALLSVGFPGKDMRDFADDFMEGFYEVLGEHGMDLVGGDTVRSTDLFISVTVVGEADPDKIIYRSGARLGDEIWVSGFLGQAAAGLEICRRHLTGSGWMDKMVAAHLDPTPLVLLGETLGGSGLVHAMMDLSDGIATDLSHLCKESGLGAEIVDKMIPLSPEILAAAEKMGCSALDWAVGGGEDYQLLFTAAPANGERLQALVKERTDIDIFRVGRIVGEGGVRLWRSGQQIDVSYGGFDHFWQI